MKKIVLSFLLFIMFIPFVVNADDKLTITFDANDGSGRTKIVEVENISKVKMPGSFYFENLNDDPEDPLDDKIIYSWNMNVGEDISTYSKTRFHLDSTYDLNNYFKDSNNITIYAEWQGRVEVTLKKWNDTVSGDSVRYENNDYIIEPKTDFTIEFKDFSRKSGYQLLYYKLPSYFTNVLSNSLKKRLEKPIVLNEKINYLGKYYTYYGKVYIKNDYLIVDFINDESEAYMKMNTITAVSFTVKYSFKYKQVTYNNRIIAVATVSGETNKQSGGESFDVYPTGKITIKYVDEQSNESILEDNISEEIVGTDYEIKKIDIDNYELVELPQEEYFYEEEPQIIYIKYRKKEEIQKEEKKDNIINTIKNPNTSTGISNIIIFMLIISSITYIIFKRKKNYIMK